MHSQKIFFPLLISPLQVLVYLEVINRFWHYDAHFLISMTVTSKCDVTLNYFKCSVHLCEKRKKQMMSHETE